MHAVCFIYLFYSGVTILFTIMYFSHACIVDHTLHLCLPTPFSYTCSVNTYLHTYKLWAKASLFFVHDPQYLLWHSTCWMI